MTEEQWLTAAIMDDTMVAELLLRLNKVNPIPSPSKLTKSSPLEWTVRQPRSRPVSVNAKKQAPRASPTTPLSWSGATSVSGGGGGGGSGGAGDGCFEESSELTFKTPTSTRSKVNGTTEATTSKRSRKKKTLAELKEEEILLIKESKELKKELALVHASLEKQRNTNQNLKRMKLDLHPQLTSEGSSCQYQQVVLLPSNPAFPIFLEKVSNKVALFPSPEEQQDVAAQESHFVLPDLNLPFDEDSSTGILCGVH